MDRLKVLGTWVILVIAFYLFSNGIIYICLNGFGNTEAKNNNNVQIVNSIKK